MRDAGYVLLTGATGFLGRYLLRDLHASGRRVAVLARGSRKQTAKERLAAVLAQGPGSVPMPVILEGDLTQPGLGLATGDRRWLAANCQAVIHAAARTALPATVDREPWRSNVEGTQHLLDLCRQLGIVEFHHVSTAFVCGDRTGVIREDELQCSQGFHNAYEQSKCEAERRVRQAVNIHATIYRPSFIVGDSRTGFTTLYQGFYRLLELADKLAEGPTGRRTLPLRLPLTGEEPRNLVPVDWVAQAIVQIVNRPQWHGSNFHLAAWEPTRGEDIRDLAVHLLGLDGVRWAGDGPLNAPTVLEELFLDHIREYWSYFRADPVFDCRCTRKALPHLPPPRLDRALLTRLIRFGIADRWGRAGRAKPRRRDTVDVAHYLECFFPEKARQSTLAAFPLDTIIALDIPGTRGGRWSCEWQAGALVDVRRGLRPDAEFTYRMDVGTFAAVVNGQLAPHEAFFARQIDVLGDIEKALKLAVLFGHFVREYPYRPLSCREKVNAAV